MDQHGRDGLVGDTPIHDRITRTRGTRLPAAWRTITGNYPNVPGDNRYSWMAPPANSTACYVKVKPNANPTLAATNVDPFSVWDVDEDFETLDFSQWPWRTNYWEPWSVVQESYHNTASAKTVSDNGSWLDLRVDIKEAGFVGFFWKTAGDRRWHKRIGSSVV